MNRRRRRIARARRKRQRLILQMREWTRTHDGMTETPRGRMREPVLRLRAVVLGWEAQMRVTGMTLRNQLDRAMARIFGMTWGAP